MIIEALMNEGFGLDKHCCPSYITVRVEEVHGISVIVAAARFVSGIAEESA